MGELLEKYQLRKTILQRRKQGLLGTRGTKDSTEHEIKKNQLWCRIEDVRTIPEEDVNTDRWRTETPPGTGNMGGQSQKENMQGGEMSNPSTGERDGESNENRLEARIVKLEEQSGCMIE